MIVFTIWYLIGVASFIYWWTSEHDLTFNQLPIMFIVGLGGLFTFFFGYYVHGKEGVLFKKRK